MIEALLAAGLLFWGIVVVLTILLFIFIEYNQGGWATISLLAVLGILQWWARIDIIGAVQQEPLLAVAGIAGYLIAGTLWAFVKWWFYTKAERRKYDEFKAEWLKGTERIYADKDHGPFKDVPHMSMLLPDGTWSDEMKGLFAQAVASEWDPRIEIHPQVTRHKQQIYLWLCYWPWSLTWTLIDDPVRRAFRWIYGEIRQSLQRVSDDVWADTKNDMPSKKG